MPVSGFARQKAALISAAFFFVAVVMTGCAGPDAFGGSRRAVEDWGLLRGFVPIKVSSATLPLLVLARGTSAEELHVYIEGDGAAWATAFHPPRDPTPEQPVGLALAANDPAAVVAYLGRPCQYLDAAELKACPPRYWTSHRFAPEVVATYQATLDVLKERFGTRRIRLFGYSGGGVLAALLAGKRDDVEKLVTIAAPVSVAEWTAWHGITPLTGSLDPATEPLAPLPPALHFVGSADRVVPPGVVAGFAASSGGTLRLVPEFDHQCCWSRDWRRLLEETR
jgi:pimeloyl-ACP methyl ester carboxylesterase